MVKKPITGEIFDFRHLRRLELEQFLPVSFAAVIAVIQRVAYVCMGRDFLPHGNCGKDLRAAFGFTLSNHVPRLIRNSNELTARMRLR